MYTFIKISVPQIEELLMKMSPTSLLSTRTAFCYLIFSFINYKESNGSWGYVT
jgi:hypothetical protein